MLAQTQRSNSNIPELRQCIQLQCQGKLGTFDFKFSTAVCCVQYENAVPNYPLAMIALGRCETWRRYPVIRNLSMRKSAPNLVQGSALDGKGSIRHWRIPPHLSRASGVVVDALLVEAWTTPNLKILRAVCSDNSLRFVVAAAVVSTALCASMLASSR